MIYKDTKINYKVCGDGKKYILFLHGWGGSIASFAYMQQVFATNYSCISVDFPPFGESGSPQQPWTLQDYAIMIINLIKHLGIDKVNIVCHSFGARVAIYLAALTTLVDRLVIIDGAGIKPKKNIFKQIKIARYKFCKKLVKIKLLKSNYLNKFGSEDYKQLSPVQKQTFKNIINFDQTNMLKYIKCDTLLLWGKDDKDTPMYMAKRMHKLIPNSALITYSGGHFAYLEHMAKFCIVINQFFI